MLAIPSFARIEARALRIAASVEVMEKANAFELRVVFENGVYFSYHNPSDRVCIQLSDCPNWKNATSVLWRNLPAQWSVDFFQKDGCNTKDGDIYYWTGKMAGNGVHTFKTPQAVRSIYTRPLWGNIPWSVARRCVQLRQRVKVAEAAQLSNETSSGGGAAVNGTDFTDADSCEDGDISSSWFEPIEEEVAGSAEMEWRPIADVFLNG